MITIARQFKKAKKQPVKEQVVQESKRNFNTYIQMVEKKAYELYEKRGRQDGHDQEDWIKAENLIEDELCK